MRKHSGVASRRVYLLVALISIAANWAVAQTATVNPARQVPVDVVFSASGGISKGAYQGGVDWTISEFLRRQRVPALRTTLLIDHSVEFVLKSATGASAGNINALFVALGWCTSELERAPWREQRLQPRRDDPAEIPAEDSLFWQAWIPTGLTELSHDWKQQRPEAAPPPPPREVEPAAFSRQLFQAAHKPAVRDFMERAKPYIGNGGAMPSPTSCSIPVGLTLTKLSPVSVRLREREGAASVQRFASVFHVVHRGTHLDFAPAIEMKKSASLGALAMLPGLNDQSEASFGTRLNDVFDIVLASSSFPLAFAPRKLCYEPGGLVEWTENSRYPCDAFADGGVFDNNPIGLAYRLNEMTSRLPAGAPVNVAYSSPGNYRNPLLKVRTARPPGRDQRGIGSAAQLLGGAFQAARDYELQAFARMIARDVEQKNDRRARSGEAPVLTAEESVRLKLSSRSMPIYGETLSSFGAFLGRPMREYDFYAGVYDGLEFVAKHFICADQQTPETVATCTATKHAALVESNAFHLSEVGVAVTNWMLARERHGQEVTPEPSSPSPEGAKRYLLWRLHEAIAAALVDAPKEPCAARADIIESTLCEGGLEEPLRRLAGDAALVESATKTLQSDCALISIYLKHCAADSGFANFLRQPRLHFYREAVRLITAIDTGEGEVRRTEANAPSYELPLNAASALFNGDTMRYRRGVEFFQSTARLSGHHIKNSIVAVVAPNYAQLWTAKDERNLWVLGWKPLTWTVGPGLYASTNLEWTLETKSLSAVSWAASLGKFVRWKGTISSWEAGFLKLNESRRSNVPEGDTGNRLRLSIRALGEKLQLTVYTQPKSGDRWRDTFGFGVGPGDTNGLLHWLLRVGK